MVKMMSMTFLVARVVAIIVAVMIQTTHGTKYYVGDKMGWTLPPSCSAYANWASQHKFKVGDSVAFQFKQGKDNVAEVTKEDFISCNTRKVLRGSSSSVAVIFGMEGYRYFVSTVPKHCIAGQKVAISVS